MLTLYKIVGCALYPFFGYFLNKRLKNGKESKIRFKEKLGLSLPQFTATGKKTFWFCAASVGESLSVLSIINELCLRGNRVVITTTTLSSANLLAQKLPEGAIHCFTPIDSSICVNRFLNHFKPDVFVLVEEEFWPCMVNSAQKFCKKTYFLNAKFSQKSMQKWTKYFFIKKVFIKLLNSFNVVFVSSHSSIDFFKSLSVKIHQIKSLKYYTIGNFKPLLPSFDISSGLDVLSQNTILALSTHNKEDEIILDAFCKLKTKIPKPFLFLMPRHVERSPQIEKLLQSNNLKYELYSSFCNGDQPLKIKNDTQVLLIDKLGLVSTYCLASKVVIVCGSMIDKIGGHNILEPAFFEKPIITGPYNENFADIVKGMQNEEAIIKLKQDGVELSDQIVFNVVKLFQNTSFYKELSTNAKNHVSGNVGGYKQICDSIEIV